MAKQMESLAELLARETIERRANKIPRFLRRLTESQKAELFEVLDGKLNGTIGHSRKVLAEVIGDRFKMHCSDNILQAVLEWRKQQTNGGER